MAESREPALSEKQDLAALYHQASDFLSVTREGIARQGEVAAFYEQKTRLTLPRVDVNALAPLLDVLERAIETRDPLAVKVALGQVWENAAGFYRAASDMKQSTSQRAVRSEPLYTWDYAPDLGVTGKVVG